MSKLKRKYVCQACGGVSHRWQGQCGDCAEWNTLAEEASATVFSDKHDLSGGGRAFRFVAMDEPLALPARRPTGLAASACLRHSFRRNFAPSTKKANGTSTSTPARRSSRGMKDHRTTGSRNSFRRKWLTMGGT